MEFYALLMKVDLYSDLEPNITMSHAKTLDDAIALKDAFFKRQKSACYNDCEIKERFREDDIKTTYTVEDVECAVGYLVCTIEKVVL